MEASPSREAAGHVCDGTELIGSPEDGLGWTCRYWCPRRGCLSGICLLAGPYCTRYPEDQTMRQAIIIPIRRTRARRHGHVPRHLSLSLSPPFLLSLSRGFFWPLTSEQLLPYGFIWPLASDLLVREHTVISLSKLNAVCLTDMKIESQKKLLVLGTRVSRIPLLRTCRSKFCGRMRMRGRSPRDPFWTCLTFSIRVSQKRLATVMWLVGIGVTVMRPILSVVNLDQTPKPSDRALDEPSSHRLPPLRTPILIQLLVQC